MRAVFIVIFCLVVVHARSNSDTGYALLKIDGKKVYDIAPFLKKYIEGDNAITVQRASLFWSAGKFENISPAGNAYIDDGLENRRTWYALSLKNTTLHETSLMLEFILSGVNAIACFRMGHDMEIHPVGTANINQEKEKEYSLLAHPEVINISLRAGEQTTLLFCTINNGQLLYTRLQLHELSYFTQLDSGKHHVLGMFQGIFLFIIIFNLLIFITTLDGIYFYYALYAFLIGIFALNETGATNFTLSYFPVLGYFSGQTFLFSGFAVWLLLMLKFLNLGKNHFLLYRATITIVAIDLFLAFLPVCITPWKSNTYTSFQHVYRLSMIFVFTINIVFLIIVNLARMMKGNKLALFYTIANIPVVLGTVIYLAHYYNLTSLSVTSLSPIALGLSIETFLISFGFAYRYNLIQREKQKLLTDIHAQQRESTRKIIDMLEAEQKRFAHDLHDELGGNLAAIKMILEGQKFNNEQLTGVIPLVDKTSASVRNIAHNLMPPGFESTNLTEMLDKFYMKLNMESKINFTFHSTGSNLQFSKQEELMIYRIILELTNNIIKHAEATRATIQLIYYDKQLELMVEDNGKGIGKNTVNGMGLKSVQSRVDFLEGSMNIDSGANGVTIIIQIPYNF